MRNGVIEAIETLADVVTAETRAIAARDLPGAAALAAGKTAAMAGFLAARGRLSAAERSDIRLARTLERLEVAANENRAALEDALALQARVVKAIVHAAGQPGATGLPGYVRPTRPDTAPMAFSVRA
jgi:hypothetical protein